MSDSETSYDGQAPDGPSWDADGDVTPDTAPGIGEEAGELRKPGLLADPVVRTLTFVSLGILALWLSGIASALIFGLLSPTPQAPRTAVERALRVYEQQIRDGATDPELWANYIGTLTSVGQYNQAQRAIDRALESAQGKRSPILLRQALLHFERGRFEEAIEVADETMAEAEREQDAENQALQARNIQPVAELPVAYSRAMLLKADSYTATGDRDSAIAIYDEYLEDNPTAANIFVLRGDLRAQKGDTAGAEEDYRAALQFIPDYEDALAGLERIGVDGR